MNWQKIKRSWNDQQKKYWHDEIGFNFRLTNMQAAIGYTQLENANSFIKKNFHSKKI